MPSTFAGPSYDDTDAKTLTLLLVVHVCYPLGFLVSLTKAKFRQVSIVYQFGVQERGLVTPAKAGVQIQSLCRRSNGFRLAPE